MINFSFFSFPVGGWAFYEPWDSHLNTFMLDDGNLDTCLDFFGAPPIHILHNKAFLGNKFIANVILPDHLENQRRQMITVFKYEYQESAVDYSLSFLSLKECELTDGNVYLCVCDDYCQVFVRITTAAISVQENESLAVCEILILNL